MKNIRESVFGDIFSSKKDEVLNVLHELENSKLIHEDEDALVIKVDSKEDLNILPDMTTVSDFDWTDGTKYGTGQTYVIYDFTNDKQHVGVATAYANGYINIPHNMKDFKTKYKIKEKSIEELTLLPIKNIVDAYDQNKIDLNKFDFEHIKDIIKEAPMLIKGINTDIITEKELIELSIVNPTIYKYLPKSTVLALKKAKLNTNQKQKLADEDFYAFLAKEIFVDTGNGMYKKDYEIESLNKIDQFSTEGQQTLGMLHLRSRFQPDVTLYYLWTNKDLLENTLDDKLWRINEPEFEDIRRAVFSSAKPAKEFKHSGL